MRQRVKLMKHYYSADADAWRAEKIETVEEVMVDLLQA